MKKKLTSLLAVAALSACAASGWAQAPIAGALGMPLANSLCESTDPATLDIHVAAVHCFDNTLCHLSPPGAPWVEFLANQGPIAKALGMPAAVAPDKSTPASVDNGCDVESGEGFFSSARFANPLRSCSSAEKPSTVFDIAWAPYPVGNFVWLLSAYADPTPAGKYEPPSCPTDWCLIASPGLQFSAGGSVCLFSVVGGTGLGGQQNFSHTGAGASVWVGCVTESGIEIRAGFFGVTGSR